MLHITLILADLIFVATQGGDTTDEEGVFHAGKWRVTCTDAFTGKTESGEWDNKQLHAVVSLALGSGEDKYVPDETVDDLYKIAEPLFTNWAKEVRPIP